MKWYYLVRKEAGYSKLCKRFISLIKNLVWGEGFE